MSRKVFVILAALTLVLSLPATVLARSDRAVLIGVHATRAAAKPGPTTANCSNAPTNPASGGYEFTGWEVQDAKTARLNASTVPSYLSTGAVVAALDASFDAWDQAESAAPTIDVTTGSTITRATANHQYDLLFGRTSGSSIAVTYTWQWSNGEIESDTVFNSRLAWFMAGSEGDGCYENQPKYELRNIAVHEFGHTYGLGHAADGRWETMYPYGFTGETLKWSLGAGDTAGVRALY
jgi:Matrixin